MVEYEILLLKFMFWVGGREEEIKIKTIIKGGGGEIDNSFYEKVMCFVGDS